MPAKGWRKDEQESNLDTILLNENLSIDNFVFPKSIITKICKSVINSNDGEKYLLAKDTQIIIQRASILFINFIYHHAKQLVKANNRKIVNADDIINALSIVGFSNFKFLLDNELDAFNERKEAKKMEKVRAKELNNNNGGNSKEIDDEIDDNDNNNNSEESSKRVKLDENAVIVNNNDDDDDEDGEEDNEDEDIEEDIEEDDEDEDDIDEDIEENDDTNTKVSQFELEQKELEGQDPDNEIHNNDTEDVDVDIDVDIDVV